ncbi:MAG: hypothetical protein JWO38_3059 [Gemmataceae bacterium]|nr:hypothetical protein [Gemmataceae bacterium]
MPTPATVLLSATPQAPADDLRRLLPTAGYVVADHSLGSPPSVDFGPLVAAVVEVGNQIEPAAAQTRRWRVELGDQVVPILWVIPAGSAGVATQGLDAGADACLARPFDPPVFTAQVKAMARCHASAARLWTKAGETRLLGDQLRKAYAQLDHELEMARRVHRTFLPRSLPDVGGARFAACHRPRSRAGGDFYDVRRLDEDHVGFFLGDVVGRGAAAGSLLGVFVNQMMNLKEITGNRYRLVPPDEVLVGLNRELIGLGLDDPPLVALLVGTLNVRDGEVSVARAGLPAPVYVPGAGDPLIWTAPGPFLGTADTTYQLIRGTLSAGDKLVAGSDGARPDSGPATDQLGDAAGRHRGLSGQAFLDAVARDLLPHVRHPDDFTLLAVEMVAAS